MCFDETGAYFVMVHEFLSYPACKQTNIIQPSNVGENITSSLEVITLHMILLQSDFHTDFLKLTFPRCLIPVLELM